MRTNNAGAAAYKQTASNREEVLVASIERLSSMMGDLIQSMGAHSGNGSSGSVSSPAIVHTSASSSGSGSKKARRSAHASVARQARMERRIAQLTERLEALNEKQWEQSEGRALRAGIALSLLALGTVAGAAYVDSCMPGYTCALHPQFNDWAQLAKAVATSCPPLQPPRGREAASSPFHPASSAPRAAAGGAAPCAAPPVHPAARGCGTFAAQPASHFGYQTWSRAATTPQAQARPQVQAPAVPLLRGHVAAAACLAPPLDCVAQLTPASSDLLYAFLSQPCPALRSTHTHTHTHREKTSNMSEDFFCSTRGSQCGEWVRLDVNPTSPMAQT